MEALVGFIITCRDVFGQSSLLVDPSSLCTEVLYSSNLSRRGSRRGQATVLRRKWRKSPVRGQNQLWKGACEIEDHHVGSNPPKTQGSTRDSTKMYRTARRTRGDGELHCAYRSFSTPRLTALTAQHPPLTHEHKRGKHLIRPSRSPPPTPRLAPRPPSPQPHRHTRTDTPP